MFFSNQKANPESSNYSHKMSLPLANNIRVKFLTEEVFATLGRISL